MFLARRGGLHADSRAMSQPGFKCTSCGALCLKGEEGPSLYICTNCKKEFVCNGHTADQNLCPRCTNKQGQREGYRCPSCEIGCLEEVEVKQCEHCGRLIECDLRMP